jgi:hypothetical protein
VSVNRLPVNIFHRHPGRAVHILAAVNELGNVRVAQRGQHLALQPQSGADQAIAGIGQTLDCEQLVELAVAAATQKDLPHAALTQAAYHFEWTDLCGQRRGHLGLGALDRGAQRVCATRCGGEHRAQARCQIGVVLREGSQESRTLPVGKLKRFVESLVQALKGRRLHG